MNFHLLPASKTHKDCLVCSDFLTFWTVGFLAAAFLCSLKNPFTASFLILSLFDRTGFFPYFLSAVLPAALSIIALYFFPAKFSCCVAFLLAFLSAYVFGGIMMAFPGAPVLALAVFSLFRFLALPFLVLLWLLFIRPADHRTKLIGIASSAFALMLLSVIGYWWFLPFCITVFKS